MKFKKGKYYKCVKDFYMYDVLLFKKNKKYQLLSIDITTKHSNNDPYYLFMGEHENGFVFSYDVILKLFNNDREKKFKRILNVK